MTSESSETKGKVLAMAMAARRRPRSKCPVAGCGKKLTAQGLPGHLKAKHPAYGGGPQMKAKAAPTSIDEWKQAFVEGVTAGLKMRVA